MAPHMTFSVAQEGSSKSLHLDVNKDDSQVVVASSSVFRIYDIEDNQFRERVNLRGSKAQNLNYSCNDVCWNKHDPNILATAATNGAVVLWNLGRTSRAKQEHVFQEHQRTVNKVAFHPLEANYLLSGSQDGTMKLFDVRTHEVSSVFVTNAYSVRDVAFCPHGAGHIFAAGMENGQVQLWDVRRPDKYEKKWPAHSDHIFAVDWHPESKYTLASAGRDKQIKVWNTSDARCEHLVHSIGPVGRVQWRPRYNYHLASCSGLVGDFSINVWDVRRPYMPFAVFNAYKNVATDIVWLQDPDQLLSGGKDNLIHHAFSDSSKPSNKAPPIGIDFSSSGKISTAFRDINAAMTTPTSTLSVLPEVVPRFPASSLTPTESSTSIRMGNFLRNNTTSSGQSDTSPLKKISSKTFSDESSSDEESRAPPPTVEKDLFLTFLSQMYEHTSEETSVASIDYFVVFAQKYMTSGASVEVLCDHNAQVCESMKKSQTAQTWRLLKDLICDPCMDDDDDDGDDDKNFLDFNQNRKGSHETSMKESETAENHRDDESKRGQNRDNANVVNYESNRRRGSSTAASEPKYKRGAKNASAESGGGKIDSEDEMDEDDYAENELTLTNIASGQMLTGGICNDFFGDNEIGVGDLEIENFVSSDIRSNDILELKSEAFEPRIKLNMREVKKSSSDGANASENGANNSNGDNPEVGTEQSQINSSGTTVIVEDQTSALLCVESALDKPMWQPHNTIRETLFILVDSGDVQTAITMYMVLMNLPEFKHFIEDSILEFWFNAYLEVLHKFKLYNVATNLIKKSPIAAINQINQQSTTFLTNCTKCNKALARRQGSWWCDRCRRTPNLCSICQDIVRGLFLWCQGCAHGGHLKCLKIWYKKATLCPTGCGHHCEYQ